ncbi:MAG: hypothetical protein GF350_08455 [Chitinivibrionales bacterium]|nr:hypothetical protein [Chitinivibrionales bacterium]
MAHKSYFLKELKDIASGHSSISTVATDSGTILITEYGARILGLFPRNDLPNCLWNPEKIDSLMNERSWMVGGERLWIAPERDFYYENPRDFEGHKVPAGMDPGDFKKTGNLTFKAQYPLFDFIRNETYEECFSQRSFKLKTDPFNSGLAFVGVEVCDTISVNKPDIDICCWSMSMVYTCGPEMPGTAFFPVADNAAILGYFGQVPEDRAQIVGTHARFRIDADGIYKIAFKPEDTVSDNKSKIVYISPYPDSDSWFCLVKRSGDIPRVQEECVDPPKADAEGPRGAIQAYNNGPDFGDELLPFGEIELQLAKGITKDSNTVSTGTHELLCYSGSKSSIVSLAKEILRLSSDPLPY